jgi:hypothetical protein
MKTYKMEFQKLKVPEVSKVSGTIFVFILLLGVFGCSRDSALGAKGLGFGAASTDFRIYAEYSPVKINILPLTEFIINPDTHQGQINLFVSLLDSFGSQIKSPCIFRFELYSRVPRSSEPKGGRIKIWPDVNLIAPKINNEYWRDFLRAYEFNLPFEPQAEQSFILEVTCICPNNKRISSEFSLKISE